MTRAWSPVSAPTGPASSAGRIDGLLDRHEDALAHSARRPLLRRMSDGTVSPEEYSTYLAIEQAFVHTAARLLGYCIWQEPDWDAAVIHARSLAGLVGEQTDYFSARVDGGSALPPGADALEAVVTQALATGGYAAVVTCLCAAETLYSRWCSSAAALTGGNPTGLAAEWILLHTTPSFTAQVAFLGFLVDRIDPVSFGDDQLDLWFGRMLRAEDTFHDSALPAETVVGPSSALDHPSPLDLGGTP